MNRRQFLGLLAAIAVSPKPDMNLIERACRAAPGAHTALLTGEIGNIWGVTFYVSEFAEGYVPEVRMDWRHWGEVERDLLLFGEALVEPRLVLGRGPSGG